MNQKNARRTRKKQNRNILLLVIIGVVLFSKIAFDRVSVGTFGTDMRIKSERLVANIHDLFTASKEPVFPDEFYSEYTGYAIYDLKTDIVLKAIGVENPVVPASLTKLFTAHFARQHVDLDTPIAVESDALAMVKKGGSVAGLLPGDMKASEIMQAMLIPSGNDASYVLAEEVGKKISGDPEISANDAVAVFMAEMNRYLQENGYAHTHLTDPSGDAEADQTTADDLYRITKELLEDPFLSETVAASSVEARLPSGETVLWSNTNPFVNYSSGQVHPNITGVKTGSLNGSYSLILRYERKGDSYLILILGQPSRLQVETIAHNIIFNLDESYYGTPGILTNKFRDLFRNDTQ